MAVAITLPGCGGSDESDAIVAAVERNIDAGTARSDLTFEGTILGQSLAFAGEDAIDYKAAETQGTITYEEFAGIPPNTEAELYTKQGELYAQFDFAPGDWVKLPPDPLSGLTLNPVRLGDALEAALEDVEESGTQDLDGETMTAYEGGYDIEAILDVLSEEEREELGPQLEESVDLIAGADVEALIDDPGYLRMLTINIDLGGEDSLQATIEFRDFGDPVEFDPPSPDEIVPLTELQGRL